MRRICFFETRPWEREFVSQSPLGRINCEFHVEVLRPELVPPGTEAVSVFVHSRLDASTVNALPQTVRLIATRSTGCDHIDLRACRRRGIAVCNVPRYGEHTVAEHTFALILSLSRNVHRAHQRALRHGFSSLEGLEGFDLQGKVLGVIGGGNIGLHVVKIARGFDMEVLVHDQRRIPILAEVLGFSYVGLEELLRRSDIVTLHVPLTRETHHLINRRTIRLMKPGALLINTSRGAVVELEALLMALDEGILRGAGLDVIEGEELLTEEAQLLAEGRARSALKVLLEQRRLLEREDVVITPHIGFYSREALQRIISTTVDNVLAFLEGRPQNLVA